MPVPMKVSPHLARPGSLMAYALDLPTAPLERLAPAGSVQHASMVECLTDGPPQHALANAAMMWLIGAAPERATPFAAAGFEAMSGAVDLPSGLDQAFGAVAGELGMATASWLFVRAVARCSGDEGVAVLADRVGGAFTVLDAVARGWLAGS